MNKRELEKLRVMYDEDNECWCITNESVPMTDNDVAYDLGVNGHEYEKLLLLRGGYLIEDYVDCVGFETKEIAEQCLEAIKNYNDDDIIEKVEQSKSIVGATIVRLDYDIFAESYAITLSNGRMLYLDDTETNKIKGEI
jgi:hypothetical protein